MRLVGPISRRHESSGAARRAQARARLLRLRSAEQAPLASGFGRPGEAVGAHAWRPAGRGLIFWHLELRPTAGRACRLCQGCAAAARCGTPPPVQPACQPKPRKSNGHHLRRPHRCPARHLQGPGPRNAARPRPRPLDGTPQRAQLRPQRLRHRRPDGNLRLRRRCAACDRGPAVRHPDGQVRRCRVIAQLTEPALRFCAGASRCRCVRGLAPPPVELRFMMKRLRLLLPLCARLGAPKRDCAHAADVSHT